MTKRLRIIAFIITIILAGTLIGCGGVMEPQDALDRFTRILEEGRVNELTLRIYMRDAQVMTPFPLTLEMYKREFNEDNIIVVEGSELAEHLDLLKRLSSDVLVSVDVDTRVDAREYYVFEYRGRKLFDVVMWVIEGHSNILINGQVFEDDLIFFEILMPFLSERQARSFEWMLDYRWPDR